mgnify:CR=1 FL=1
MGSLPLSQEERDLGGLRLAAARRAWERALDRIPHPVRELAAAAPRAGRLSARRPRAVAFALAAVSVLWAGGSLGVHARRRICGSHVPPTD